MAFVSSGREAAGKPYVSMQISRANNVLVRLR